MNSSILRILDANANRAREALRVVEDYARFGLDDQRMCAELKGLRHDLAGALAGVIGEAILHRDTPGDVGTENKTVAEGRREDLAAVVTAAGKRLGEALRTIEEYLKVVSPGEAPKVELIRYHFYDVELRIARTLGRGRGFADVRVYVLITEASCRRPWQDVVEAAIAGGADCLQLREKQMESGELLQRARWMVDRCCSAGVISIINDRPDIALLAGADGVHVGQTDLPAAEARKLIGPEMILGVSTHNMEQAKQAVLDGADYIGVGPVFKSGTKTRDFVAGLEYAREAAAGVPIPTVAIAGITQENVAEVMETGVSAVAVTAAVAGCEDPRGAVEAFKKWIDRHAGGQTFLSARKRASEHPAAQASQAANAGGQTFLSAQKQPSRQSETNSASAAPDEPAELDREMHKTKRRLPHWHVAGATYFLTFRIMEGEFTPAERSIILEHIRQGDPQFYTLFAVVVMPDHVHMIIKPADGVDLPRIMKGTKGASSKKINQHRGDQGHVWQDESWDRIIRTGQEFEETMDYLLRNPERKQIVVSSWDYPWLYRRPRDRE